MESTTKDTLRSVEQRAMQAYTDLTVMGLPDEAARVNALLNEVRRAHLELDALLAPLGLER